MDLDLLSKQLDKVKLLNGMRISSHCRLQEGSTIGEFTVVKELGKGRFAKVWCIKNKNGDCAAVKIYRFGDYNLDYYDNEVKILNRIFHYALQSQNPPKNLIGYLGTFAHVEIGHDFAPRIHPCIMFQLAGDHVGRLLRHFKREYNEGLPLYSVKKYMRDILTGLDYLHKCGVVHTDIKPSNLLMDRNVEDIDRLDDVNIYIGDLGSSTPADDLFTQTIGTDGYLAPELIVERKYNQAVDVWAAFATCYELITGELLFDVYDDCDIDYGDDIRDDIKRKESDDESPNESSPDEDMDDVEGGYESSDSSGSEGEDESSVGYKHLLLAEKVLGPAPKEFTEMGRKFYNARGKLKNNPDIDHISISILLRNNYHMEESDCIEIEEFLKLGLTYLPEERISCEEALRHPWLNY
jgi:serine/threonine protein kinase